MPDRAWVTYLSNNSYLDGCLVLAFSLRKVRSRYPLIVMVPISPPLAPSDLDQLKKVVNIVIHPIDVSLWKLPVSASPSSPSSPSSSSSPGKEDEKEYLWDYYAHTWAKLGAWGLTEYKRLVLMDCDMLVRINMDQLLNARPTLSATTSQQDAAVNDWKVQVGYGDAYLDLPDGWVAAAHACTCNPMRNPKYPASWTPDSCAYSQYTGNPCPPSHNRLPGPSSASAPSSPNDQQNQDDQNTDSASPKRSYFNSGLVVFTPSLTQLDAILSTFRKLNSPTQYLFPDQDLLNDVFVGRWRSLGYGYNALKTLSFAHSSIWNEDPTILKNPAQAADFADATSVPANATRIYSGGSVMPVINIHYIMEKPWNVPDLAIAQRESNRFVELYRWWWQAYEGLQKETVAPMPNHEI